MGDNGPSNRELVTEKLSALFGVVAHHHRIRIIQELRSGPLDVSSLREILDINQSALSQHLAVLRSSHLVVERRDGRRVFYSLARPDLASWLLEGTQYIAAGVEDSNNVISAVNEVRNLWLDKGRSKRKEPAAAGQRSSSRA